MKPQKLFFLIPVFAIITTSFYAQNLVINPSFENYSVCPTNSSNLQQAVGWYDILETPDYYNVCSTWGFQGVPANVCGYQSAASGDGYAGLLSYGNFDPNFTPAIREYAVGTLTAPLIVGTLYHVSFKLSLTELCSHAVNHMGG